MAPLSYHSSNLSLIALETMRLLEQIKESFLLTVKKGFNRVLWEYLFHASRTSLMALNSGFIEQRVVIIDISSCKLQC